MSVDVVLATHNRGKVEEFRALLDGAVPGIGVRAYDGPEPVEDGVSFVENALIKARAAAAHTGLVALADDSGIGVDVLGGSPGIFSARWAGHGRGAEANIDLLLDQLADLDDPARSGRFTCVIALVVPDSLVPGGLERVVEGVWPGRIATERRGTNGHGYDPVFVPEGGDATAAELSREEKNRVSHRGRAFEALRPALAEVAALLEADRPAPAS